MKQVYIRAFFRMATNDSQDNHRTPHLQFSDILKNKVNNNMPVVKTYGKAHSSTKQ